MGATRLLLIDFLNIHPYSQVRGEALPFVQGWAAAAGVEVRLAALGLPPGQWAIPDVAPGLPDEDVERVAAAIADFGATHVLTNLPVPAALRARVAERGGAPAFADLGDRFAEVRADLVPWLRSWIGLADGAVGLLPDLATPDFGVVPLNDGARETVTAVRVIAGRYRWKPYPVLRSPFFKPDETDANSIARADLGYPYETPPVELALRQIEAAQRTLPADRRTREYMVHGADVLLALDELAAAAAEREAAGAMFLFSVEPDAVVAAADAVERALPRLRDAGHRLLVGNLALLNFSRAECERIAAPAGPDAWVAAEARLRDWEARFPGTFLCMRLGGFGIALYTPWTTLADLRENLAGGRTMEPRSLAYFTTTRARLVPGTAAAARAEADGLLVDASDPAVFGAGADEVGQPHERGLPWRFRDPRVARLHALVVRMLPDEGRPAPDDPYFGAAQTLRGALGDTIRENPLEVFALMLDVVEAAPEDADVRALLQATLDRIGKPDLHIGLEDEPEEEDGRLRPPDDEVTYDARRLDALLGALDAEQLGRLQGYRPESVVDEHNVEGHRVIAVTLRFGDERLMVNLLPRQAVRGSFALTTKYAICYHQETPIDSREKEIAAQALTEMVEEATTRPE